MALPWGPLPCSFLAVSFTDFTEYFTQYSFFTDRRPSMTFGPLCFTPARVCVQQWQGRMTYLFVHCIVLALQSDAHLLASFVFTSDINVPPST